MGWYIGLIDFEKIIGINPKKMLYIYLNQKWRIRYD